MAQSSITNYFNKRKRSAVDEAKRSKKVIVFDRQNCSLVAKDADFVKSESSPLPKVEEYAEKRNLQTEILSELGVDECSKHSQAEKESKNESNNDSRTQIGKPITTASKANNAKVRSLLSKISKAKCSKVKNTSVYPDIRLAFSERKEFQKSKEKNNLTNETNDIKNRTVEKSNKEDTQNVPESKCVFSPSKREYEATLSSSVQVPESQTTINVEEARKELGLMTPNRLVNRAQKELSIAEIKAKVSRSARLAELRQAISKFNSGVPKLKELELKRQALDRNIPQIQKCKQSSAEASPIKGSPQKEGPSVKQRSPAYKRLASLAQSALPLLPLPFRYQNLAETFHCVDTVISMLYNRSEIITFRKLKPAVQEMMHKDFTERHLGQIKKLYPELYMFHQEKCRTFGSSSKADQYELVILPILESKSEGGSDRPIMTPSCLLIRKQIFQQRLLEVVHSHHEVFLRTLNPPMVVERSKLARWHPSFDLDQVADVAADELPQPPNVEVYSTAKDVLDKAKDLFKCNLRMERALQNVSAGTKTADPVKAPSNNPAPITSTLSDMYKGIPKAILERVRARQAAKAMMAMTRSPAEDRESLQRKRLPEIVRILRGIYITEKKAVISQETVLVKLAHSYREKLSIAELEQHLRLLMNLIPGWLTLLNVRSTDYLRLNKNTDVGGIISKLEALAAELNNR